MLKGSWTKKRLSRHLLIPLELHVHANDDRSIPKHVVEVTLSQHSTATRKAHIVEGADATAGIHLTTAASSSPSNSCILLDLFRMLRCMESPQGQFWIHTIQCPGLRIVPARCIVPNRQHLSKNERNILCHLHQSILRHPESMH